MRRTLALMVIGMGLVGCDLVEAPAGADRRASDTAEAPAREGAFRHDQTEDISGYYRAAGVAEGDLTLTQVFVGQTRDFEDWEAGRRTPGFAPVMMEFSRGGETLRVLPDRYAVGDDRISMRGTAPGVGEASFDVRMDKGALATARRNLGGAEDAAMTGSVRIGGRAVSGVKLHWYGGD